MIQTIIVDGPLGRGQITVFSQYPFENSASVTSATITITGTYNYRLNVLYNNREDGRSEECFRFGGPLTIGFFGNPRQVNERMSFGGCVSEEEPEFMVDGSLDLRFSRTFLPDNPTFNELVGGYDVEFVDRVEADLEGYNADFDYSFDFSGLITVEYQVPAPATAVLFSLGLAGFAAARRRLG